MPKVDLSEADVKAGYLIQKPAWVPYRIKQTTSKPSKAGDSTNYFLVVIGLEGDGKNTSSEMKDVEVLKMYNSKIKKFMTPFFKAASGNSELPSGGQEFDDYVDVILEGYTQRGEDQDGNPINDIKDWRPASKV